MSSPETAPNRTVAAILSLIWPGVGHVYLGRFGRAAMFVLAPLALLLGAAAAAPALVGAHVGVVAVLLGVPALGMGLVAAVDAAMTPAAALKVARRGPRAWLTFAAWTAYVVITVLARLCTRAYLVEAFKIASYSMTPSLTGGDHIFVDKTQGSRMPSRGDVVVFRSPEHEEHDFATRVLAVAGDSLRVDGGHAVINGFPLPSCLVGTTWLPHGPDDSGGEADVFVEYLGARAYLIAIDKQSIDAAPSTTFEVKPSEAFVVGDNRLNSYDSRAWFGGRGGGVPLDHVKGVAFVRWLALGSAGIDWSRTSTSLEAPTLPREMATLAPGLVQCLASRPSPSSATPPAPAR